MYLITIWEDDIEIEVYPSNFTKQQAEDYASKFNKEAEKRKISVRACASLTLDHPPTIKKLIKLHS